MPNIDNKKVSLNEARDAAKAAELREGELAGKIIALEKKLGGSTNVDSKESKKRQTDETSGVREKFASAVGRDDWEVAMNHLNNAKSVEIKNELEKIAIRKWGINYYSLLRDRFITLEKIDSLLEKGKVEHTAISEQRAKLTAKLEALKASMVATA